MPKVRFEIYSTERGKKLIDLAEIMVEAGYLQSFHLDEEASEVIFNFEVNVGFDIKKLDINMEELRSYFDAADDIGKKFSDDLLKSIFDLDDTGHIWKK
jgi:predicted patatin/cPLA2 family phospholipase